METKLAEMLSWLVSEVEDDVPEHQMTKHLRDALEEAKELLVEWREGSVK